MNLSDSLLAFNGEGLDDLPVKGNLDRLIRDVQGAGDGRIVVDCNIHAEYTSNPRAVADFGGVREGARASVAGARLRDAPRARGVQAAPRRFAPVRYFESWACSTCP